MAKPRMGQPRLLVTIGTLVQMGGAERQALYLVEHLARNTRAGVSVLAFEDGEELRVPLKTLNVPVEVFPYFFRWPKARRAKALAKLARLLRNQLKPDALLPFVGIHSKTMALVWPYTNARFCWWNQQDEGRDLHGTNVEKKILRRVSTITSNSTAGRDFLAQTYDLNASSIHVYNNGTPLLPLRTNGRGAQSRPRRKVVTMVANITRYKDHRTLIDAWGILRREMPAAAFPRLLLAGNLRDGNTVADLKAHAFDIGLSSEDVTFLGAVDDVPSLLQSSDLLVHSSLTEGCPNSVCEAMSAGLAVVATDIPGCRQALGETGLRWLVEPKNPGDLASRVRELLSDDQLRTEVGLQNRARIARDFSIDGMNRFFQEQIEAGLETSLS